MQNKKRQFEKQNAFNREHYDRFSLILPKGKKELLHHLAKRQGKSLNALLNEIIESYLNSENE